MISLHNLINKEPALVQLMMVKFTDPYESLSLDKLADGRR